MVLGFAILSNLLLASVALAVPPSFSTASLARRDQDLQSRPLVTGEKPADALGNVVYSTNWAGVALVSKANKTFDTIVGTFTVPHPNGKSGDAAIWVGIDGYASDCPNILQTGIYLNIDNGVVSYGAWYEWYPAYWIDYEGITIRAGDVISIGVHATSPTSGVTWIENHTTSVTLTRRLSSSHALCLKYAEWIVEDYTHDGSLVPFADFGSVTFTDSYAYGGKSHYRPSSEGSTILALLKDGVVHTETTVDGDDVTIKYV